MIWVSLIWVSLIWVLMIWWKYTLNISHQPVPPNNLTAFVADHLPADITGTIKFFSNARHLDVTHAEDSAELVVSYLPVIDMAKKIYQNPKTFGRNAIGSKLASASAATKE